MSSSPAPHRVQDEVEAAGVVAVLCSLAWRPPQRRGRSATCPGRDASCPLTGSVGFSTRAFATTGVWGRGCLGDDAVWD